MRRVIPAAILVLLLASCGGERADAPAAPTPPARATTSSAEPSSTPSATPSQLGKIGEEQGAITISFMESGEVRELYGDPRDTGKRKYTLGEEDDVLYEVKPGDDGGFKLRKPDGTLLWKVKIAPDKIRVSNNEQNDNPFELKVKDPNRVKVFAPGDRELGNVRYAPNQIEVEHTSGRVIFTTDAMKPAGAYGVLLCDAIPERERYILVAELLSRGR